MGGRARIITAFAIATAGLGAACGSFGASDEPDVGAPDRDASANDATPADTGPDASAGDGGGVTGRYCDRTDASFCEDYETPPKSYAGWSSGFQATSLGGSIEVAPHPSNTTNALRVLLGPTSTNASGRVTREYRTSWLGKVHVEADVHIAPVTFGQRLVILSVYFGDTSNQQERLLVDLVVHANGAETVTYSRGAISETLVPERAFAFGQTQRVLLDVDVYGTGTGSITYGVVGGPSPAQEPVDRSTGATGELRVLVGLHRYDPNSGAPELTAYYDNVTITPR